MGAEEVVRLIVASMLSFILGFLIAWGLVWMRWVRRRLTLEDYENALAQSRGKAIANLDR